MIWKWFKKENKALSRQQQKVFEAAISGDVYSFPFSWEQFNSKNRAHLKRGEKFLEKLAVRVAVDRMLDQITGEEAYEDTTQTFTTTADYNSDFNKLRKRIKQFEFSLEKPLHIEDFELLDDWEIELEPGRRKALCERYEKNRQKYRNLVKDEARLRECYFVTSCASFLSKAYGLLREEGKVIYPDKFSLESVENPCDPSVKERNWNFGFGVDYLFKAKVLAREGKISIHEHEKTVEYWQELAKVVYEKGALKCFEQIDRRMKRNAGKAEILPYSLGLRFYGDLLNLELTYNGICKLKNLEKESLCYRKLKEIFPAKERKKP